MKSWITSATFLALLTMPFIAKGQTPAAKPLNLVISATKKKLDVEKSLTVSETKTTEKWAYKVVITNSTFAEQTGLTVDYRTYMRDDAQGRPSAASKLPLRRQPGSETVPTLANGKTYTFITKDMKIETAQLQSGWVHSDGSEDKIKDSLYGIWIRITKNGEVVAEYINPTSLKTKAKWD